MSIIYTVSRGSSIRLPESLPLFYSTLLFGQPMLAPPLSLMSANNLQFFSTPNDCSAFLWTLASFPGLQLINAVEGLVKLLRRWRQVDIAYIKGYVIDYNYVNHLNRALNILIVCRSTHWLLTVNTRLFSHSLHREEFRWEIMMVIAPSPLGMEGGWGGGGGGVWGGWRRVSYKWPLHINIWVVKLQPYLDYQYF